MAELDVTDRIYESAFAPELWPTALEAVGEVVAAATVNLFVGRGDRLQATSTPRHLGLVERFAREGWFWRGQLTRRMFAARRAGFVRDIDLFTEQELEEEPIYRDLWRPKLQLGWAMGTAMPLPTEDFVSIIVPRLSAEGPYSLESRDKLDALRPHLARASLISARLQLERASAAAETLAMLGLPALLIADDGRVLAANDLIGELRDVLHWRAFDRVCLRDAKADQLLREALISESDAAAPRSFPARNAEDVAAYVVHLIPVRGSARDIFVRSAAVLLVTPATAPKAPPIELIRSLFDLTPMEARAAYGLAQGKSNETIAAEAGISVNTVRTHMRGLMEKTGMHRQGEITALLAGLSVFR